MTTTTFFKQLWQDYIKMTPQAEAIHSALLKRGEQITNDHVAFRTFNIGAVRLEKLEPFILDMGYQRFEPYHFKEKKLDAIGYVPTNTDLPRIFLSELRVEELTPNAQAIIQNLVNQVPEKSVSDASIFWRGRLWVAPSYQDYQTLLAESEYAAWLSIIGLRCNHFTISLNALKTITDVEQMNQFIETLGYSINASGGRVKGSPEVLLEQSSTLASRAEFEFAGQQKETVTTCYYEFAKRYLDKHNKLYEGFVAASADKIFESTNVNS